MLRKRLRMTLDFEVEVEELTDGRLREYYRQMSNYEEIVGDEAYWANLSRQTRLHKALLEDEGALRRFLTYVIVNEVDPTLDGRLGAAFGVGGLHAEDEILEAVFARLDAEGARYFREVHAEGLLSENTPAINSCFIVRRLGARLEEVNAVAEGVVDKAEEGEILVNGESDNLM